MGNGRARSAIVLSLAVISVAVSSPTGGDAEWAWSALERTQAPLRVESRRQAADVPARPSAGQEGAVGDEFTPSRSADPFVANEALGLPVSRQRELVAVVLRALPEVASRHSMRVERSYGGTAVVHHCRVRGSTRGSAHDGDPVASLPFEPTQHVLGLLASEGSALRWVVTDVRSMDELSCW